MLDALLEHGVEFLVVGAFALALHGTPRATGDLDLWVRPTPENAARVMRALCGFGAPAKALGFDERDVACEELSSSASLPAASTSRPPSTASASTKRGAAGSSWIRRAVASPSSAVPTS